MKIQKTMPKDRWMAPITSEYAKSIGIEQGGPVYVELDALHNRIIITSSENDSEVNLKSYSKEEISDLIEYAKKEFKLEENRLPTIKRIEPKIKIEKKKEYCAYCNKELQDHEQLKINGKRICSDCKKIELQKFLLYLERRKFDEERRKLEKEENF